MRMEAGLDTGPVLLREAVPIGPRDTGGQRCTTGWRRSGARLIVDGAGAGSTGWCRCRSRRRA